MGRIMNSAGVSIVEMCIAMLIVGMAAILISTFTNNSLLMMRNAQGSETAYFTAENKLSDLAAAAFPVNGTDTATIDNTPYYRSWVVSDSGFTANSKITVRWNSLKGMRQISLSGAVK